MTEQMRQEFWASLCLKHTPGLGPRTSKKILERFGSAAKAVDRAKSWPDTGLATSQQLQVFLAESWRVPAEVEFSKAEDKGTPALLWSDPLYPERLREIPDPPLFLYAIGDLGLLDNPGVAVVGSRDCSRYGIELASRIALDLSEQGVTIISGLAYGIDREAHLGGLKGPGSSIAVMGTGPDLVYPAANRDIWRELADKGLILSEFPPGTKPLAGNFPLRNRIISGLSLGALVVEASTRSGSLITARLAMEQGREVFAVPGPVSLPSYRGCHEIINKGAKLVHDAGDILVELKPQLEAFLAKQKFPKAAPMAQPHCEQASLVPDRTVPAAPSRRSRASKAAGIILSSPPPPKRNPKGTTIRQDSGIGRCSQRLKGEGQGWPESSPLVAEGLPPANQSKPAQNSSAPSAGKASPAAAPQSGSFSFEDNVAGHLAAMGATHIDSLCRVFGKDASEISRTLVVLELKGVVRRLPGGYYLTA